MNASGKRHCEVVIIGGGISGTAIAWTLMRSGVSDCILFEKEALASGATGICPGGIRQQFSGATDCVLARRSYQFWNQINDRLQPEHAFEYEPSGYLFLAHSDEMLAKLGANVQMQNSLQIPSEMLDRQQLRELLPHLCFDEVLGGSYCAEDGFIEDCDGVTNQFARVAVEAGARVVYSRVERLEPRTNRGWRVRAGGEWTECRHVVLAAGVDTPALTEPLGLKLPIVAEKRRLAFTEPHPKFLMPPLVVAPEISFAGKQLTYGVFYLGWLGEKESDDELLFLEKGLGAGATLLPLLAEIPVRRILTGIYDNSPDARPILGSVPGLPGLHLAVGFSGHGFMIAPAAAEIVACSVTGKPTDLPIEPFSLQRFQSDIEREGLVI